MLTGDEPGIRGQTRRDLLGEPAGEDARAPAPPVTDLSVVFA
ncbi:hypothetical protein [Nonomuraea turkmeniaca]|nr:hypothetical protein [Nonomuraea turkmeniaca]